ncbi:MAG: hypothetical protein AAFZ63_04835 [Bacteroidota bacterium]
MLPTIQIHNTLPLNLKVHFTAGPNADSSLFVGRRSKVNVSLHPNDVFDISWSRNSEFSFIEGVSLASTVIDQTKRVLTVEESQLKSFENPDAYSDSFPLNFDGFAYYKFDKDGKLATDPLKGDSINAKPGDLFKVVLAADKDKANGSLVGYFMVDPQFQAGGDDSKYDPYAAWMTFNFSSFGSITDGAYAALSSSDALAYRLPNYNPGLFLAQDKGINLHEGQIVLYNQVGTVDDSGACTFPDGTQYIAIDHQIADLSTILKTVASYFGDTDSFDVQMIQFGPNTGVDTFSDTNFGGSKSTLSPDKGQWLKTDASFASLQFVELETQAQAHMHVQCDLAQSLSHDTDPDAANPTEFRVNVQLARQKKDGTFPKIRLEVANQDDFNSDFNSITVNGKSYDFDSNTNQTDYISPNGFGKVIATWSPSDKRTGTPKLYLHTEAMPAHSAVVVSPATTMHHRMAKMQYPNGNDAAGDFTKHIITKAGDKKIKLGKDQAGKVKDITQHLQKSVVHSFKHTSAGNQTHHVIEGASFVKAYQSVTMDYSDASNPTFSTQAAGSSDVNVLLAQFQSATVVAPTTDLVSLISLGDIEHVAVSGAAAAYDTLKKAGEAGEKALKDLKKLEDAVENALVAAVKTVGGDLVYYAIQTVEEVATIVSKIYDAIKVAITDIIAFFEFLFTVFEDIKEIYSGLKDLLDTAYTKYFSQGAIDKLKDEADKLVTDAFDKIDSLLDAPPSTDHQETNGHKASNPGSDSAKEKLNWLLTELLHELEGGNVGSGTDNPFTDFVAELKEETGDATLAFAKKTIGDFTSRTNPVDNLHEFGNDFMKNLKSSLGGILDGWEKSIKAHIVDVAKDVEKNPLDQGVSQQLPPCFTKGIVGRFLKLTGLGDQIHITDSVTPADALCLLYAIPAGISYALINAFDNLEAVADPAPDPVGKILKDPVFWDIMAILTDITKGVTATLNVEKGAGGSASSLPDLVKQLFQGFGIMSASVKSYKLIKYADDSPAANVMKGLSVARIAGGFIAAGAIADDVPLAKVQCGMDVFQSVFGISYAIYQMTENPAKGKLNSPYLGYSANLLEAISGLMELAVIDEEPDSRTAAIILMDAIRLVGATLRIADLIENK